MDSLEEILASKNWDEPPVVAAIKKFVQKKYNASVGVQLANEQIIITAGSSSLASAIRSNLSELAKIADTNKKLVVRIS